MANPFRRQSKTAGSRLNFLLPPFLSIAALWNVADAVPKYHTAGITFVPKKISLPSSADQVTLSPTLANGIVLKADRQGHFRGTTLVNNVPMPFLIDTGATMTSIPAKWAGAADLPVGQTIKTHTAGGQVIDQLTKINSFQIGMVQIKNLDAQINVHVNEVLVGMNALKYFHLTQSEGTLILVLNEQAGARHSNTDNLAQPSASVTFETERLIKKPTIIKKTVTCNEHQLCRTTYSDHDMKTQN